MHLKLIQVVKALVFHVSGHVNEAFEKISPGPDEILHTDGLNSPTGTINIKVDLKKHVPPEDGSFEKEFLNAHNAYRKMHQAPPLVLSSEPCAEAQRWAEHLLEINRLEPSCSDNGENMYHMSSSVRFTPTASLSQDVWKDRRELGVGLASDGKRAFIVGRYHPAGNFTNEGYFEKNVLPKALNPLSQIITKSDGATISHLLCMDDNKLHASEGDMGPLIHLNAARTLDYQIPRRSANMDIGGDRSHQCQDKEPPHKAWRVSPKVQHPETKILEYTTKMSQATETQ
ncbi:hypothetical protein CRENBAI_011045 [Crenichthys baileyi]|uniref:SCP domain-containing protein n=1 Tax=Crenichthys baileyi TaxID=28760 RepID=A0AAV9RFX3_9TELE